MSVSTTADFDVSAEQVRRALASVIPHAHKTKTGDHAAERRLRLVFTPEWLYVMATNGHSTALAKVWIDSDSRIVGPGPEAAPGDMVADIDPRQAKLILNQFKLKPSDPEVGQTLRFRVELDDTLTMQDVGGLLSAEETLSVPLNRPAELFPDVRAVISRALAGAGASTAARDLVAGGKLIDTFKAASDAYQTAARFTPVGSPDSPAFLVSVGDDFRGVMESAHTDPDATRRFNDSQRDWLTLFPTTQLKAV